MQAAGVLDSRPIAQITVSGPVEGESRIHRLENSFAIIGRSRECDIHLDGDEVSYRHAYLQSIGGRVLCTDLCSRTGVIWNEGTRPAGWLNAGQVAKIGPYELKLSDPAAVPDESTEDDVANPLDPIAASARLLPRVRIEAMEGKLPAQRWKINRTLTLIGRSPGCALRFKDKEVSTVHCALLLTTHGFSVIDLLGKGGTLVDNKPVRFERLNDGSVIEIADYRMRVLIEHPSASSAPAPAKTAPPTTAVNIETETAVEVPGNSGDTSADLISGTEFFKVMRLARNGQTLIVTFLGDASRFHYADVHRESNMARWTLSKPDFKNVIIDFGNRDIYSAVNFTTACNLARVASDRGGRAVFCNTTNRTMHVLETMHYDGLWPRTGTLDEALAAVVA
ncbi:MAG: FHA domain-containing protein [Planctomycetaceae bacterium]